MNEAKRCAFKLLRHGGCNTMNFADFKFTSSINTRQTDEFRPDVEFVAIKVEHDDYDNESDEHNVYDTANRTGEIEDMEDLIDKIGGEIILKNCQTDDNKHVFTIRGLYGKIYHIKKSTMLWNLTSGRLKRSNDRLRRFHRLRMDPCKTSNLNHNVPKSYISVGDWIIVHTHVCHVSNFVYQTGRSKTCPLPTVPVNPPTHVNSRGISVAGNLYNLQPDGKLLRTKHGTVDIDLYVTHIRAPNTIGLSLTLHSDTIQ